MALTVYEPDKGAHYVRAPGFQITWQDGPVKDGKPNGAFIEDVLSAALARLDHHQRGPFPCPQNAAAMKSIQDALNVLASRTREREKRGVEGTLAP